MRNIPMKMPLEHIAILENILLPYIGLNNRKCDRYTIAKGVYALMSWKMRIMPCLSSSGNLTRR